MIGMTSIRIFQDDQTDRKHPISFYVLSFFCPTGPCMNTRNICGQTTVLRRLSHNSATETPPVPDFAELTAAPSAPPPCPPGMPTCNRRFQKTTYSKIPYTLRGSELILAERKQSPYTDIKISLLSRRCPRQGITGHCRKCFRSNASFHAWIFL